MAKLLVLPEEAIISGFKGTIDFYYNMGIPCVRRWPRSPGPRRTPAVEAQWPAWGYVAGLWNELSPEVQDTYRELATGSGLSGRDMFTRAYLTGLYRYETGGEEDMRLTMLDPEQNLVSIYPVNAAIAWTDIDISAKVPAGSSHALCRCRVQRNHTDLCTDWKLFLRAKGGSQTIEAVKWRSSHEPTFVVVNDVFTAIGTDTKLEYSLAFPAGGVECSVVINLLGYLL